MGAFLEAQTAVSATAAGMCKLPARRAELSHPEPNKAMYCAFSKAEDAGQASSWAGSSYADSDMIGMMCDVC
jgi:hypothetical protein